MLSQSGVAARGARKVAANCWFHSHWTSSGGCFGGLVRRTAPSAATQTLSLSSTWTEVAPRWLSFSGSIGNGSEAGRGTRSHAPLGRRFQTSPALSSGF
jgi:hypothetical protein